MGGNGGTRRSGNPMESGRTPDPRHAFCPGVAAVGAALRKQEHERPKVGEYGKDHTMKQVNDEASRLSLGAVLVTGIVIVVLHAAGAVAAEMKGACERDPDHSVQHVIESPDPSVQQLIKSKAYDFHRVPKDIQFTRSHGIWKNRKPTTAFYLPVLNEKFSTYNISCPITCNSQIKPACEVTTPAGVEMLAVRNEHGELEYFLKDDFEPVPSKREKPRP